MITKSDVFNHLRSLMKNKQLTQKQVDTADYIISKHGLMTLQDLLNYQPIEKPTSISKHGLNLIKQFEGFKGTAYQDSAGVWTIGYGTTKYPNLERVKKGDTCTPIQAEQYLMNDCNWVTDCINKQVTVTLNQNQYDSLASFVYNIGATAFAKSTLLNYLNQGQIDLAAKQFDRWTIVGGRVVAGLSNRRKAEKALFLKV